MSRHSSHDRSVTIGDTEFLSIIREEQCSPAMSSVNMNELAKRPCSKSGSSSKCCVCKNDKNEEPLTLEIDKILNEKEAQLRNEYNNKFEEQMTILKERFDYILQNEQVRSSYMLREAHRERQEKIAALQNQLECKNLAALMYVLATERRKSRLEKMRIVEEYTNHINALQTLLSEGQSLILNLARGYKTAARIDQEWREKMKKVVGESFVHTFAGGEEVTNQYFFDLPALLKTRAPIHDDLTEDPCEEEDVKEEEASPNNKDEAPWWDRLQSEHPPFVVFGDMAEFKPPERRAVLRVVKGAKTAPRRWKEYVFNEMNLKSECGNLDSIKAVYPNRLATGPWDGHDGASYRNQSESSRRVTSASIDTRNNMGSILKIITATQSGANNAHQNRATILAARDSMEIASSTKILREKRTSRGDGKVVLDIRKRTASIFQDEDGSDDEDKHQQIPPAPETQKETIPNEEEINEEEVSLSGLGSTHHDSLEVMQSHVPDVDAKINYEKVCPMEQCKRMQVDSFMRALPPYMRASPFTHFEQSFEEYEVCSPEQLKILRERIEAKKNKDRKHLSEESDPLSEWQTFPDVGGVGVQTSVESMAWPPCTCLAPSPTPASSVSNGQVYKMADLVPVKQLIDHVNQTCLHDRGIEFDRFKVVGEQKDNEMKSKGDFGRSKFEEIKRILQRHPSLCDIFQGSL